MALKTGVKWVPFDIVQKYLKESTDVCRIESILYQIYNVEESPRYEPENILTC